MEDHVAWNHFCMFGSLGRFRVFAGDGGFDSDDVQRYVIRSVERNSYQIDDPATQARVLEFWRNPNLRLVNRSCGARHRSGLLMVIGIVQHKSYECPVTDVMDHASRSAEQITRKAGMSGCPEVEFVDTRNALIVEREVLDMRLAFLCQRLNRPRPQPLGPCTTLLARDEAMDATWKFLYDVQGQGCTSTEVAREARHLLHRLGGLRGDLQDKLGELGVPCTRDPDDGTDPDRIP